MSTKVFSLEYGYFLVCDWVIIQHVYKDKYLQEYTASTVVWILSVSQKKKYHQIITFQHYLGNKQGFFLQLAYKSICNKSFQLLYLSTLHYQIPIQLFIHSVIIVDIFVQSVDIAQMIIIVFQNSETIQDITLISA